MSFISYNQFLLGIEVNNKYSEYCALLKCSCLLYGKLISHTYFILVASNDRMNNTSNFIMKLWCFSVSVKVVEGWIYLVAYSQATFIHSQIFIAIWTSMFDVFQTIDATRNTGTTPSPKMKVIFICAYHICLICIINCSLFSCCYLIFVNLPNKA